MKKLILLGGGKIGTAITALLSATGDYQVTVADRDAESLARLPEKNVRKVVLDVTDATALKSAIKGHDILASAMLPGAARKGAGCEPGRWAASTAA